jgi:hypothetical protein
MLPVSSLHFSHSKVRSRFSGKGCSLLETLAGLSSGAIPFAAIPTITVVLCGGRFVCLSNRRLHVFKELLRLHPGVLPNGEVPVRLRCATPQEAHRFRGDLALVGKIASF